MLVKRLEKERIMEILYRGRLYMLHSTKEQAFHDCQRFRTLRANEDQHCNCIDVKIYPVCRVVDDTVVLAVELQVNESGRSLLSSLFCCFLPTPRRFRGTLNADVNCVLLHVMHVLPCRPSAISDS